MSEIGEMYIAIRKERQAGGRRRRTLAAEQYPVAAAIIRPCGVELKQCSDAHYQLIHDDWVAHFYPGNLRIRTGGPFIELPSEWTLMDLAAYVAEGR